jgi:hypothetical protein
MRGFSLFAVSIGTHPPRISREHCAHGIRRKNISAPWRSLSVLSVGRFTTPSVSRLHIVSNGRMTDELKMIWKEAVVT